MEETVTPEPRPAPQAPRRPRAEVRADDLEPYLALRYIGRMFKVLAVVIGVSLLLELVLGLIMEGAASIGTLLGEAMRLLALGGLLWAGGDIVRLMIDAGHDLRRSRLLLARLNAELHHQDSPAGPKERERPS
jgi:hypothetical protein